MRNQKHVVIFDGSNNFIGIWSESETKNYVPPKGYSVVAAFEQEPFHEAWEWGCKNNGVADGKRTQFPTRNGDKAMACKLITNPIESKCGCGARLGRGWTLAQHPVTGKILCDLCETDANRELDTRTDADFDAAFERANGV